VLVLGFDGASPRLIDQWIDDLPAFRAMRERGVYGETIPPTPAQTPVAWTTFMTGNNPGNHGIFSFALRRKGTYERDIIRPDMIRSNTLPRILNDAGRKVAMINIPMTDTDKVNGFIVPGFMSLKQGIAYPPSVKEKIHRKFGIERILGDLEVETLERVQSDPDLFFEKVDELTDQMAEVSLWLSQEEPWDFFMVVFMGLDRVQHFFWEYIDATHRFHKVGKYGDLAKRCYRRFDKIVSDFTRSLEDDTTVIVLSDHGFCPVHTELILNDYLEDKGFLTGVSGKVDVEKSQAISYGYGDIWLNLKGREPAGLIGAGEEYEATRTKIVQYLSGLSVNGEKAVKDVKRREDLWCGGYLSDAPDLTAIFKVGFQAARRPELSGKDAPTRHTNDNPRWSGGHDGTHDPEDVPGTITMSGPGIRRGKRVRLNMWDLAPTILKLMKIDSVNRMDGKPLDLLERTA